VRGKPAAPPDLTESSPGKFIAVGSLTFATAKLAREKGLAAFAAATTRDIEVDCRGLTASDSAGMTVLLDWLSFAKHSGRSMHYGNLPEQVQAVARLSDALELLEKGV
jgi:phospholipid transport system transporter-binding protein